MIWFITLCNNHVVLPFYTVAFTSKIGPVEYEIEAEDELDLKRRVEVAEKKFELSYQGIVTNKHAEPQKGWPILEIPKFSMVDTARREIKREREVSEAEKFIKGGTLETVVEAGKMEKLGTHKVEVLTTDGWQLHGEYAKRERAEAIKRLLDAKDFEVRIVE